MKELTQGVFEGISFKADWAGVDYDGNLNFGEAINPRVSYNSGRFHSYNKIGETIKTKDIKRESSIFRIMPDYKKFKCIKDFYLFKKDEVYYLREIFNENNNYTFISKCGKNVLNISVDESIEVLINITN
jgi:hypothetical protein